MSNYIGVINDYSVYIEKGVYVGYKTQKDRRNFKGYTDRVVTTATTQKEFMEQTTKNKKALHKYDPYKDENQTKLFNL